MSNASFLTDPYVNPEGKNLSVTFDTVKGYVVRINSRENSLVCKEPGLEAKNLQKIVFNNGDVMTQWTGFSPIPWENLTSSAWCYSDPFGTSNDAAITNGFLYGILYNWYAVTDPRGLAPDDYYIPSSQEYQELIDCLGEGDSTLAAKKLRAAGTAAFGNGLWLSSNGTLDNTDDCIECTNKFSALPGGWRNGGVGMDVQQAGYWWTSDSVPAYFWIDENDCGIVFNADPTLGCSVRVRPINPYKEGRAYYQDVLTSITEGNMNEVPKDLYIETDRRIFAYNANATPTSLFSVTTSKDVQFYWEDTTQNAVSYSLMIRSDDEVGTKEIKKVHGNSVNFEGVLEPLMISAGQIGTIKIVDRGKSFSLPTLRITMDSGTGVTSPTAIGYTDRCGKLEITKWKIQRILFWTSTAVDMVIEIDEGELLNPNGLQVGQYVHLNNLGNAFLQFTSEFNNRKTYYVTVKFENALPYSSNDEISAAFLNNVMDVHSGISILSFGVNVVKPPKIIYDKYPNNVRFAIEGLSSGRYYWKVASIYDCEEKNYSEWSKEELLIVP